MELQKYVRAPRAHFLVQSAVAPVILQFISPISLIEQLSTYDVERKYLRYTGNSNDEQFPDEISKYADTNDIEVLPSKHLLVFKTCLEDVLKTCLEDVLKTS